MRIATATRPMPAPKLVFAALAISIMGQTSCSDLVVDPVAESEGEQIAVATIAELAQYVPTFHLEADSSEFAELITRFEDDLAIDARVSLWRGDRLVFEGLTAEVEIRGGHSRLQPLKSLGITLDREVDNADGAVLAVPALLGGHSIELLRNFRLRNGGGDFAKTMLKDLAYARMVADSDLRVVPFYGEPAAAFVNGEFYGLLNLRTEGNANSLSRLLNVPKRDLQIAELDGSERTGVSAFDVKDGPTAKFRALESAIRDRDLPTALTIVDEGSFIDFVLVGTLFAVWDWPYKNVRAFAVADGPIRFCVFDFDEASRLNLDRDVEWHMTERPPNPISDLFALAYADADFRTRFDARRDELLASGKLSPDALRSAFRTLANVTSPVIDHQTNRYGVPTSRAAWWLDLERHVEQYEQRYREFAKMARD